MESNIHTYAYVGPFLECRAVKKEREVPGGLACPKCSHQNPLSSGLFCPDCGTHGKEFTHTELSIGPSIWDLPNLIYERLVQLEEPSVEVSKDFEIHIWTPNDSSLGKSYGGDVVLGCRYISADVIATELKRFRKEYSTEVGILAKAYDDCQLRWGVVTYWY